MQNKNHLQIKHDSITAWSVKVSWTREKSSNCTRACSPYLGKTFMLSFIQKTRAMICGHAGKKTEVCFCVTFASWKRFSGQSETRNKAWSASRRLTAPSCVCMWNWETLQICSSWLRLPTNASWTSVFPSWRSTKGKINLFKCVAHCYITAGWKYVNISCMAFVWCVKRGWLSFAGFTR